MSKDDRELYEMMRRCREEIETLRKRIEHLEPKAHAYDSISTVLGMMPRQSLACGEDLLWTLKKRIAEIDKSRANEAGVSP